VLAQDCINTGSRVGGVNSMRPFPIVSKGPMGLMLEVVDSGYLAMGEGSLWKRDDELSSVGCGALMWCKKFCATRVNKGVLQNVILSHITSYTG
jgi:hypothetical protein